MKKTILFITHQLPYPPVSGGVIKSWNLVNHFAKNYTLSLACLLKNEDKTHTKELESKIELQHFITEELNIERSVSTLIKSYASGDCLNVYRNKSEKFKQKISAIGNRFDIVFIDHYTCFQYVPKGFKGKIVFHEHNAEYIMWQRFAEQQSFLKKVALYMETKRVAAAEQEYCKKSNLVLAAPNDIEALVNIGVDKAKCQPTFHLGEDVLLNEPAIDFNKTGKSLLYIGTLTWEANIVGLLWFLENSWEAIADKHEDVALYIVGKSPDQRLIEAAKGNPKIIFTGFVEDLKEYYNKSRVAIVPLTFGSGIKVKVLNALYRGLPIVTTNIGAEGLELEHNKHLLIANNKEDYIQYVNELLTNEELAKRLSSNGRAIAKEKYTWASHLSQIDEYLMNC